MIIHVSALFRKIKKGLLYNPSHEMDEHPFHAQRTLRLFLKILRDFAGGKGVRYRFLLPQGKLCSAKIVSIRHCRTAGYRLLPSGLNSALSCKPLPRLALCASLGLLLPSSATGGGRMRPSVAHWDFTGLHPPQAAAASVPRAAKLQGRDSADAR